MATRSGRTTSPQTARGRQAPQKRSIPLIPALIAGAVMVVLAVGAFMYFGTPAGLTGEVDAQSPGQVVPTMESRQHVEGPVRYSTNPPTSGDHSGNAASWGIYPSTPPPDERLVHNLEHGGVIIYYDSTKISAESLELLKTLARDLRTERTCLVLTQRESIQDDKTIALTAWGVLATLDDFDEGAIRAFWRDHVANGPELGKGVCG